MTSSRQHHLQYTGGLAETQGLLLPLVIVTLFKTCYSSYRHNQFFSELILRDYCSYQNIRFKNVVLLSVQTWINRTTPRFLILPWYLQLYLQYNQHSSSRNHFNRFNLNLQSSIQWSLQQVRCQSFKHRCIKIQMATSISSSNKLSCRILGSEGEGLHLGIRICQKGGQDGLCQQLD